MNLDTLVSVGQSPWQPVPAAGDIDVWSAALHAELQKRLEIAAIEPSDPEELLSAAQGVIETLPV